MKNQGEGPGQQAYGNFDYYRGSLYFFGLGEESNEALFYKFSLMKKLLVW